MSTIAEFRREIYCKITDILSSTLFMREWIERLKFVASKMSNDELEFIIHDDDDWRDDVIMCFRNELSMRLMDEMLCEGEDDV